MTEELTSNNQSITPSTGVVLLAFGKLQYYWAAYNLAFSINKHNPNVNITVLFDDPGKALSQCHDLMKYVNHIGHIALDDIYTNKKLDPGKVKVNLYKYLPYDCNLYLDVDAIALKDIQPMIDELSQSGKTYISHCVGYHTIDKGRDFKEMQWAWACPMVCRCWSKCLRLPSWLCSLHAWATCLWPPTKLPPMWPPCSTWCLCLCPSPPVPGSVTGWGPTKPSGRFKFSGWVFEWWQGAR